MTTTMTSRSKGLKRMRKKKSGKKSPLAWGNYRDDPGLCNGLAKGGTPQRSECFRGGAVVCIHQLDTARFCGGMGWI
jgi:hypothetical protein